jgi:hypothetical protein
MNRIHRGTTRHRIVTKSAQTGAPGQAIVNREGGGTVHPTLGCGDVARSSAALAGLPR